MYLAAMIFLSLHITLRYIIVYPLHNQLMIFLCLIIYLYMYIYISVNTWDTQAGHAFVYRFVQQSLNLGWLPQITGITLVYK